MNDPTGSVADGSDRKLSIVIVVGRFPPHHKRGVDVLCRDVALSLSKRGHRVTVLTSRRGARGVSDDHGVRVVRALPEVDAGFGGVSGFLGAAARARTSCRLLRRELSLASADVLYFWHQDGLSGALLGVEPSSAAIVTDVSDEGLLALARDGGNWFGPLLKLWKTTAGGLLCGLVTSLFRLPKRPPSLPPGSAYFTSRTLWKKVLSAGLSVQNADLVTLGVDLRWFKFAPERPDDAGVRILFLGSVAREGGLHTAVLALRDVPANAVLRVAGPVKDKEYLAEVAELGRAGEVMQRIEFSAPVSRTELPALLRSAHVLVVGDSESEAFPRTLLQAFAVGTPVVGTAIGPSADALIEGKTGLVFDVGNSHALARQLSRILQEPELREEITRTARKLVERRYAIGYTTTQIERVLQRAAAR